MATHRRTHPSPSDRAHIESRGNGNTVDAAIALVDLAGFTALTEVHGDHEAARTSRLLAAIAQEEAALGERLVKSIGDAVLLMAPDGAALMAWIVRVIAHSTATRACSRPASERIGAQCWSSTVTCSARR